MLLLTIRRFVVALALLPAVAFAALPAGVTRGPSVEGVDEYSLQNGLQVLLFVDATKPTTTVDVTYKVGSRMEGYGETGMAHLLEHMLFKGTPTHPTCPAELAPARHAVQRHHLVRSHELLRDVARVTDALDWALDARSRPHDDARRLSKAELESEMTVVRNEFESGENKPQACSAKRMAAVAYDWHNYGKSTIGKRSDIEHVPIPRLRAFYQTYYQPDNAVLIVAGKFDEEGRWRRCEVLRRDPQADASARCPGLHRWSRCRTASAR